jgi:hypothetical protein
MQIICLFFIKKNVFFIKKINNMSQIKKEEQILKNNVYPRIIMGLDVSTVCIGVSIIADLGEGQPEIIKITHISPKVSNKIKGIEALLRRKEIFENEFLPTLKNIGITDVVIEEPLLSSNNSYTVGTLLRFNGMICDSIYRVLGIVPNFISSYDARAYSFPELLSLRKFNKKGEEIPLSKIRKSIKENGVVLFGSYPYDIDKKVVMMNKVNEMYPKIEWILNKKNELKKENYDACDSLVCALAYINLNRYGILKPEVSFTVINQIYGKPTKITYKMKVWDKIYEREIILYES